jgi:hypothetical protein
MDHSCVSNIMSPLAIVPSMTSCVHYFSADDSSGYAFSHSRAANGTIAKAYVHSVLLLHLHIIMMRVLTFPLLQTCAFWISVRRTRQALTGLHRIREVNGSGFLPITSGCRKTDNLTFQPNLTFQHKSRSCCCYYLKNNLFCKKKTTFSKTKTWV